MALSPDAIAVDYILRRIQLDGRLAYLLGDTEAVRLLVTAQATRGGTEPTAAVREFNGVLRPERVVPAQPPRPIRETFKETSQHD